MQAAEHSQAETAQILIDAGANVNALHVNENGLNLTPLYQAALDKKNHSVVNMLINKGADPFGNYHKNLSQSLFERIAKTKPSFLFAILENSQHRSIYPPYLRAVLKKLAESSCHGENMDHFNHSEAIIIITDYAISNNLIDPIIELPEAVQNFQHCFVAALMPHINEKNILRCDLHQLILEAEIFWNCHAKKEIKKHLLSMQDRMIDWTKNANREDILDHLQVNSNSKKSLKQVH